MTMWSQSLKFSGAELWRWAGGQPWSAAMRTCLQDAEWHAEGDVWTHTGLVYMQLEGLAGWNELPVDDQFKLRLTALFHDSGKPETTAPDPVTGRLRSLRHSLAGLHIARGALRELGAPLEFREAVCALVRYHGRPPFLLEKSDPAREVIELSTLLSNRLLYMFTLADFRGRDTDAVTRAEDDLHLWKLAAEEQGCFDRPFPFANDHARFLFHRGELTSLHYTPWEKFSCTATLMAGLPGAGKDTWLGRNRPSLPVLALDDMREELDVRPDANQGAVIQAAQARAREFLRAGRNFAFNATNTTQQTRRKWISLFHDYGARTEIVYVEPPLAQILRQNKQRSDRARVPEQVILRLLKNLEPPTRDEAHAVTLVGTDT
ncbi:MAG TPA: AAA family ATPase [Planctomycetota bacterium]|nr:AAA family ATPase [Planctomycetota bacterium]